KKVMKDAGYSEAHPLKLTISTYNGRPELPKIAQVIQSDAKKAIIDIKLRNVDDIQGYLKDKEQWDASLYSFGTIPEEIQVISLTKLINQKVQSMQGVMIIIRSQH